MQRRLETARIVTRGGQAYDEVEFSSEGCNPLERQNVFCDEDIDHSIKSGFGGKLQ